MSNTSKYLIGKCQKYLQFPSSDEPPGGDFVYSTCYLLTWVRPGGGRMRSVRPPGRCCSTPQIVLPSSEFTVSFYTLQ